MATSPKITHPTIMPNSVSISPEVANKLDRADLLRHIVELARDGAATCDRHVIVVRALIRGVPKRGDDWDVVQDEIYERLEEIEKLNTEVFDRCEELLQP